MLWHPQAADQLALRAEYEQFLTEGRATAVERDLSRAHVTGSAFVFTPDLQNVLLGFDKKAGFFIQLGGHVEATDESVRATARREAQEEGGIADLLDIGDGPLDLDRHDLGPGFIQCDTHWDIGDGFLATGTPITSDESEAVEWLPVDRLPVNFAVRVHRAVDHARHRAATNGLNFLHTRRRRRARDVVQSSHQRRPPRHGTLVDLWQ